MPSRFSRRIGRGPEDGPQLELAETFAEVGRSLFAERDVGRTFEGICELAVLAVEGCEAAGVSLI